MIGLTNKRTPWGVTKAGQAAFLLAGWKKSAWLTVACTVSGRKGLAIS
jgi:hypothetical protein